MDQLTDILAAVGLFRRRLFWYREEVESTLRSVGITVDQETDDEGKELLSVLQRLQRLNEKVESLTSVVTGNLSIRQADMSVRQADISQREAKLVSRLTVVALVFIPLSFTASIFSMGGNFLPGSSLFWVYFAAAVPLTFIVLALAWLLRGKKWIWVLRSWIILFGQIALMKRGFVADVAPGCEMIREKGRVEEQKETIGLAYAATRPDRMLTFDGMH